jgi:hypothetical protein
MRRGRHEPDRVGLEIPHEQWRARSAGPRRCRTPGPAAGGCSRVLLRSPHGTRRETLRVSRGALRALRRPKGRLELARGDPGPPPLSPSSVPSRRVLSHAARRLIGGLPSAHSTPPRWQPRETPRGRKPGKTASIWVATKDGSGGNLNRPGWQPVSEFQ